MANRRGFGFVVVLNTAVKRAHTHFMATYFKRVDGERCLAGTIFM